WRFGGKLPPDDAIEIWIWEGETPFGSPVTSGTYQIDTTDIFDWGMWILVWPDVGVTDPSTLTGVNASYGAIRGTLSIDNISATSVKATLTNAKLVEVDY